jgi:hypothetical protein
MPETEPVAVASAPCFDRLPFAVAQRPSRIGALLTLLLLVPLLAVIVVPIGLVLTFAAADVREAVAHKPLAAAMIATGLLVWLGLFLLPAWQIARGVCSRRTVRVAADGVTVSDTGLFGARQWSAPLAEFSGIAHRVRASLSGERHELVLVHADRRRTIVLHADARLPQRAIDRAAGLLRLPQVPAQELPGRVRRLAPAMDTLPEQQAI